MDILLTYSVSHDSANKMEEHYTGCPANYCQNEAKVLSIDERYQKLLLNNLYKEIPSNDRY